MSSKNMQNKDASSKDRSGAAAERFRRAVEEAVTKVNRELDKLPTPFTFR